MSSHLRKRLQGHFFEASSDGGGPWVDTINNEGLVNTNLLDKRVRIIRQLLRISSDRTKCKNGRQRAILMAMHNHTGVFFKIQVVCAEK